MRAIFWGAVALITYTYVGFPLLVVLRGWLRPKPFSSGTETPPISVLIAAHNEASSIGAKLENLRSLDYPPGRLEIIVASDGSDDATNEIVSASGEGVSLLALPRSGKAAALEAAARRANGEILVFSDANSIYRANAIRVLVAPFADPSIGGVAGNQVYAGGGQAGTGLGERNYWSYDRLLKTFESRAGNTIAATGAIYAIRASLFRPIPVGVNDDFFLSLGVIAQGYRLVFAPDAVAYEPQAADGAAEFARKVRVMTRAMRCFIEMRALLDPRKYGFYSLQLISHKALRWWMAVPLIAAAAASVALARAGRLYALAALVQAAFYGGALVGLISERAGAGRNRALGLAGYFCMANAAALRATLNVVRGIHVDRWEPRRAQATR